MCPLQVETSMTLGFCYLSFCFSRHEKSDVATNPKSLSDLLSLPLWFLLASQTHALFIFISLQQRICYYAATSNQHVHRNRANPARMHWYARAHARTDPRTRTHGHATPLPECDAALNSHNTTQLHDPAEPQTHLLAATQGE